MEQVFFYNNDDNEMKPAEKKSGLRKVFPVLLLVLLVAFVTTFGILVIKGLRSLGKAFSEQQTLKTERELILGEGTRAVQDWIAANDPSMSLEEDSVKVHKPYFLNDAIWNVVEGGLQKDGKAVDYMYLLETKRMYTAGTHPEFRTLVCEAVREGFLHGMPAGDVRFEHWMPSCLCVTDEVTEITQSRGKPYRAEKVIRITDMLPNPLTKEIVSEYIQGKNIEGFVLDGTMVLKGTQSLNDVRLLMNEGDSSAGHTVSLRWLYDTGVEANMELYNGDMSERWVIKKTLGEDRYLHSIEIQIWEEDAARSGKGDRVYVLQKTQTYQIDRNGDLLLKLSAEVIPENVTEIHRSAR